VPTFSLCILNTGLEEKKQEFFNPVRYESASLVNQDYQCHQGKCREIGGLTKREESKRTFCLIFV
jgi:hypothetical protein